MRLLIRRNRRLKSRYRSFYDIKCTCKSKGNCSFRAAEVNVINPYLYYSVEFSLFTITCDVVIALFSFEIHRICLCVSDFAHYKIYWFCHIYRNPCNTVQSWSNHFSFFSIVIYFLHFPTSFKKLNKHTFQRKIFISAIRSLAKDVLFVCIVYSTFSI